MAIRKRTRILVDPAVQWSIAGRIVSHWALFLVCLVTLNIMMRLLVSAGDLPFSQALLLAARSQLPILAIMFFLMPIFLRDTLKLSNRFAGPMFRLRTALSKLANGESVSAIHFRSGDFWQEAAVDFNTLVEKHESALRKNAEQEAELEVLRREEAVV
jgi:hypothetical protein